MIKPALAAEAEIKDAIKKYYDHEAVVHRERQTIQEKLVIAFRKRWRLSGEAEMKADPAAGVEWKPRASRQKPAEQEPVPDRMLLTRSSACSLKRSSRFAGRTGENGRREEDGAVKMRNADFTLHSREALVSAGCRRNAE